MRTDRECSLPRSAWAQPLAPLRVRCTQHRAVRIGLELACVGLAVALLWAAGCIPSQRPDQPSSLGMRLRPKPVLPGTNDLFMDLIYVERPVGNPLINHDLWQAADEEALGVAQHRTLQERGLRVGVLGGQMPAKLKSLFDEDELGRMNGEHLQIQSGTATQIQTSGVWPEWPTELSDPGGVGSADDSYKEAVGLFRVVPTITPDGGVELVMTPEIHYGDPARRFVPSDDRPGTLDWSIQVGRRIRTLDELRVSLRLRCGQFALLSSTATPRDSLGARFFTFTTKDGRTLQRVVLVQAEPSRAAVAARATAR